MLHEFLSSNRAELIERCGLKVAQRVTPKPTHAGLEHGVPLFLDQVIKTLRIECTSDPMRSREVSGPPGGGGEMRSEIGAAAARHGLELLQRGFTVDQVVHDYGDLCQAITDLAFERGLPMEIDEFRTLNRCLDNAIADAVTEFSRQRDYRASERDAHAMGERLGLLAHELRNLLQAAMLAVTAMKVGNVGLGGATGAVLDRSLIGLRNVIDRSLADVRLMPGMPARRELIALPEFIAEAAIGASLEARTRGCRFVVLAAGLGLAVEADRAMLSAAVGNLLQNALKFTRSDAQVSLAAYSRHDRVLIEVADHCGGLAPGHADTSGAGLGISISRSSVEASGGFLSAREEPASGCVFTIDLPRRAF